MQFGFIHCYVYNHLTSEAFALIEVARGNYNSVLAGNIIKNSCKVITVQTDTDDYRMLPITSILDLNIFIDCANKTAAVIVPPNRIERD